MSHDWAGHAQRLVLYRAASTGQVQRIALYLAASTGQVQRIALYLAASTSQVQRMALYCIAVRIDFPENQNDIWSTSVWGAMVFARSTKYLETAFWITLPLILAPFLGAGAPQRRPGNEK